MPWTEYITSLEDLNDQPAFVIMYPPGLSGEFLASALADSIEAITQPPTENQDTGRTVYREFFAHELKKGPRGVNWTELIYRANVARNLYRSDHYIILVHPDHFSLKFLREYLDRRPVIEITMNNPVSHRFAALAAVAKIQSGVPLSEYLFRLGTVGYHHPRHLQIEWQDLILNRPGEVFDQIQNFVGLTGDRAKFESNVAGYRERDLALIEQAHEV